MSSFKLPSGLTSYLTGQLPSAVDNQNSQAHAQKLTEDLSVLIILIMLIIVFRAVAAPLVTLLPAIWVLLMSGAIIAEISKAGLQVSTITQTMLTVLLLGAGTDYGLFFIMRVREEMADGASPHRAIEQRRALRRRVDHVLRGHRHRGAGHPAAGVVRAVLRARPGAGARRLPDAAGRADPAARAAGGAGPGGVLAAPGTARQAAKGYTPGWPTR